MESPHQVTRLLDQIQQGDSAASHELLPLVYDELRELARASLAKERAGQTLQPTALVHEAYLRLVKQDRMAWQNRAQFFGVAAQMMRRILVDYARGRGRHKRGAGVASVHAAGETTMILGLPLWVGQALMLPGFVLLALAGLYRAAEHLQRMRRGLQPGVASGGAR